MIPRFLGPVVAGLLALGGLTPASGQAPVAKRLLLVGQGPDDHPPTTHEYMAGVRILEHLLAQYPGIRTTVVKADEPWPEGPAQIDRADGVVVFVTQGARWMQLDPQRFAALKRLAQRQGGIVALHWAVGAKDAQYIAGQLELLGGTRGGPQRKYKVLETDVSLVDRAQPICAGLQGFRILDEFYYHLDLQPSSPRFHPLLTARIDGNDEPVGWAWDRPDGGRSFGFVGIHFHKNWGRIEYRRLVVQGILWSLKLPIAAGGENVDLAPEFLELKPTARAE